jgi:hypothetical protein
MAGNLDGDRSSADPAFEVNGVGVFVEGDGPESIVMIHGWPDTYRLWDAQAAFFSHRYRCVRFTLPGFDIDKPRRAVPLEEMIDTLKAIIERRAPGGKVDPHAARLGLRVRLPVRDAAIPRSCRRSSAWTSATRARGSTCGSLTAEGEGRSCFAYQLWLAIAWRIGGRIGDWMTLWMARTARCPSDARYIDSRMNFPYFIRWFKAYGSYRGHGALRAAGPDALRVRKQEALHVPHDRVGGGARRARPGNQVRAFETGTGS